MKMNAAQLGATREQLGIEAIPADNPGLAPLIDAFGEHSFFVDGGGLLIIEPDQEAGSSSLIVLRVASWVDDEQNELRGHEPQVLDARVELTAGGGS